MAIDRSITLPCPRCGEADAGISVRLNMLGEDEDTFSCGECNSEFSREFLRDLTARWAPILAWLEQIPGAGDEKQ